MVGKEKNWNGGVEKKMTVERVGRRRRKWVLFD